MPASLALPKAGTAAYTTFGISDDQPDRYHRWLQEVMTQIFPPVYLQRSGAVSFR